MIKLEKGAKVRVRLHNNTVVYAIYEASSVLDYKVHFVKIFGDVTAIACGRKPFNNGNQMQGVRFVGNPCVLLPVGVSV